MADLKDSELPHGLLPKHCGIEVMRDPKLNKGMAFSLRERQLVGLHGLLPPVIKTQTQQLYAVMQNFYRWDNDFDRYIYLMGLQDSNEKLFYRAITENIELMMPVIYTPTVGHACQKYGMVFRRPRGLYITINDLGHVYGILCNWPVDMIKAVVVTDGERILGLGDLGSYGMGIPVGKLALYTAIGGIHPHLCLPIMLDVGTNNQALIQDPLYIGLRQDREKGEKYDQLLDEFMEAVKKRYGPGILIQFEDFGNSNAFRLLEKYQQNYCTFNDDIQGTAAVALAGLLASLRLTKQQLSDNKIVFLGAGEAAIGIANLIVMALQSEGLSKEKAINKIWMVDSRGLIVKNRPAGGVIGHKVTFAKVHEPIDKLDQIITELKPTVLIGASAVPGSFTTEILKNMGWLNDRPIIFALSNPTSKAECTAEQAYTATNGRCVFASGSPFKPVIYDGKYFFPGQGNNAYIFPGVALAVIACDIRKITEEIFLEAAKVLASMVKDEHLEEGRVYPPLSEIRCVSTELAVRIAEFAYKKNLAFSLPEPKNKRDLIISFQYDTSFSHGISMQAEDHIIHLIAKLCNCGLI